MRIISNWTSQRVGYSGLMHVSLRGEKHGSVLFKCSIVEIPELVPFATKCRIFFFLCIFLVFHTQENQSLGGFGADAHFIFKVFKQHVHDWFVPVIVYASYCIWCSHFHISYYNFLIVLWYDNRYTSHFWIHQASNFKKQANQREFPEYIQVTWNIWWLYPDGDCRYSVLFMNLLIRLWINYEIIYYEFINHF